MENTALGRKIEEIEKNENEKLTDRKLLAGQRRRVLKRGRRQLLRNPNIAVASASRRRLTKSQAHRTIFAHTLDSAHTVATRKPSIRHLNYYFLLI